MDRRLPAIVVAVLVLAGLAGCSATKDLNPDVVARAAERTATAGGAKMAISAQVEGQTLRGAGFVDLNGQKGRLSLEIPEVGGRLDQLFVGRVLYMHFPRALAEQLPRGKRWIKIDLERALRQNGIDLGALQSMTANDPASQIAQLRGAIDLERVGSETVRGTATTHYKAVVDLRKVAAEAPASQRAAARRSVDRIIELSGRSKVPTDVWIDAAGRVRRMRVSQRIDGRSFAYTMELYGFGTRETVEAPPASQPTDLTALAVGQAP